MPKGKNDDDAGTTARGFAFAPEVAAEVEAHLTEAKEELVAWKKAYGSLTAFARKVATHLLAVRQNCIDPETGKVDWMGRSNAYAVVVSEKVYNPVFGKRPKDDAERIAWRRDSGYGSFATTLSREMNALIAEGQANGTIPSDLSTTGRSGTKERKSPLRVAADSFMELAKETGKSETPDLTKVLRTALFTLRTTADAMSADDYRLTAPATLGKLAAQVELEVQRITLVLRQHDKPKKAEKVAA